MKNKIIKIVPVFFAVCFLFSCSAKPAFDITGNWASERTLKNEMASKDDPFVNIAAIYIFQKNVFAFNEDGTFTRIVEQKTTKAESFADEINENELLEYYKTGDTSVSLTGTYQLKGKNLYLSTKTIKDGDSELDYAEYYKNIQALGPVEAKIRVFLNESGDLVVADLTLKKE